ncbi:MAG: hypothetical protein RR992_07695 [Clostridiales bacterium]
MFPLTHIATAFAVLKKENTMTVSGSLFPDFITYLGIGRNMGHELCTDLYYYTLEHSPEHLDFALGALTHGTSLPGLDTYADEEYHGEKPGFCFQQGKKIAQEVNCYCKVPKSMALWKSHNFIEMAFDVITAQRHPDLQARAEHHIYTTPNPATGLLSEYLNIAPAQIQEMFSIVPRQFCFNGTDIEEITHKFLLSLERRHGIKGGNLKDATKITEKAVAIIKPQYDDFIGEINQNLTANLSKLPKVWD